MKVLTLTQPWATLVALGRKKIETRSWPTNYRGPLAIHAAKGFPRDCCLLCETEPFRTALGCRWTDLPRGRVLCVTSLVDCRTTMQLFGGLSPMEKAFGDYTPGRYGFELGPIARVFDPALEVKGALGLWDWDAPSDLATLEESGQLRLL
jgi:hypothetical protein